MSNRLSEFYLRDANNVPITAPLITSKTVSFDAITGIQGTFNLFTVTGPCEIAFPNICNSDLVSAGGGTISLGYTGTVDGFIAATTATGIDENFIWIDTSPARYDKLASTAIRGFFTGGSAGTNVTYTIATGDITSGSITFNIMWFPLSSDSNVVAL